MRGFEDKQVLRALNVSSVGIRDRLQVERVRRVARYCIPGAARKNWRNVLGSTAYP
jgi:hypothetical protein